MSNDGIYLGFSTTNIWLSRFIRRGSRSLYSHCWVRHGSEVWGGTWITHADWPTLRTWPWKVATRGWTVEQHYRPLFDIKPALEAVRGDFEERFDWLGLLGMVWVLVNRRWWHRRIKNPLARPGASYCSEFIAEILVAAKLPGTEKWDPMTTSPKMVEHYCRSHPELFERIVGVPPVEEVPQARAPIAA
jgi:hypothetical protein